MPGHSEHYDFVIIGGGIFGVYAALYLARRRHKVCLIEKERELLKKASIVNQARLHSGYHYPRSVATAIMSNDNKERFTADHRDFINFTFEQYYAIDRYGSFTDANQFARFSEFIGIPCKEVAYHPLFNHNRMEALFLTEEYSFDPILIAEYYRQKILSEKGVTIKMETQVLGVEENQGQWVLQLRQLDRPGALQTITASQAVNATYSGSNAVNRQFGAPDIELMHEISEMVFVTSPAVSQVGLTIMDGPFASLMPYGLSGLLSLSSVAYTHHKVSFDNLPTFDCQAEHPDCRPEFTSICNYCAHKPKSNYRKMLDQIRQYFNPEIDFSYFSSYYTIKSKLKASHIDDGRPTEISLLRENPRFYCIFAGKINSIYEIEKVITT